MRASLKYAGVVSWAVLSCGAAGARVTTSLRPEEPRVAVSVGASSDGQMLASLINDVRQHPRDYIAFLTKVEASLFMTEHALETSRETLPRMLELGVVGYWQGRTVVVLPLGTGIWR
jgi:hypothetical protein